MMNFEEIKRQFDIYDVAVNQLGLELKHIGGGEYRGVSPSPGQHHTDDAFALSTNLQSWHDFSTKEGGSVLDLVAYVKFGSTDSHAIREAARTLAGNDYDSAYWEKRTHQRKQFCTDVAKWHDALMKDEQTLKYLHERRITDETIKTLRLGLVYEYLHVKNELVQEWRLACPYLDAGGKPVYMASRRLDWAAHEDSPKYHKLKQNEFLRNALFGLNTIPYKDSECDTLFIGEGLFDAVSLIQEGYHALFTIGGTAGKENDEKILQQARRFRRLITAFDIDTNFSGQRFTVSYGKKFLNAGLNFEYIPSYGEGHKDVSDYYTDGGNLHELVDSSVNGYVFMSRYSFWETQPKLLSEYCPFKSLSPNEKAIALAEVKKFIHKLQTFIDDDDMIQILDALKEYYPHDKIDKFAQGLTQQELIMMMRDDFLEGRHVFFHGTIKGGSFYEYQPAGYWARLTDASMQSEISKHFRHSKSNKVFYELTTMVRLMHTEHSLPKFNQKRLWAFKNGVLDLDTGELRQPKPDDFLTWQVEYGYDAEATCPLFDKFLAECANNETSRIDFIDDLLGYIPYEDNRLEKIFVLIGEGMNGKGTFLNVIENLVRNVNYDSNGFQSYTNVPLSEFNKPTQRIMLDGSIVNLSYDLNENLRGCESDIKSVASGESISGNRKFCDSESFTPRCKLICASNHMLKLSDDSFGMRRRLMFCRFENCFKGRENVNLKKQLISELSGIFNRMYRAYKTLLKREKELGSSAIRACIDNDELMTDFTQTANPVAAFWNEFKDEYLSRGKAKKSEIFDAYVAFCQRNGKFTGTESDFHKKLKKVASDEGITIKDTRHRENDSRPYYCQFNSTHEAVQSERMKVQESEQNTEPQQITLDDVLNDKNLELDI